MAIIKPIKFYGMELQNAYHKITSISFTETGKDETGKLYQCIVTVNTYTDETKEYDVEQKSYIFGDLRENDNNIGNMYNKLYNKEEFNGGKNI